MADDFNPAEELAKAVIGTAVNFLLPGLGSLAVAGVKGLNRRTLNQEVAAALTRSMKAVSAPDLHPLALVAKAKGWRRQRKLVKGLAKDITFAEVMGSARKQFPELPAASPEVDRPRADADQSPESPQKGAADRARVAWEDLIREQFALARESAPVAEGWQGAFGDLLEEVANIGLADRRYEQRWRALIKPNATRSPTGAEVTKWSDLVTQVFAVELTRSKQLLPYREQLEEHDRQAREDIKLWQLDTQRRALNCIAAALLVLALEYGAHLAL